MVNQLKLLKLRKILFLKAQESRDKPKVRREAGLAAISQVQADQLRLLIQRLKEIQISSTNSPVSQVRQTQNTNWIHDLESKPWIWILTYINPFWNFPFTACMENGKTGNTLLI